MNKPHSTTGPEGQSYPLSQVNCNKKIDDHLTTLKKELDIYTKSLDNLSQESKLKSFKSTGEAHEYGIHASFEEMVELWRLFKHLSSEYNELSVTGKINVNRLLQLATTTQFCREAVEAFEDRLCGKLDARYLALEKKEKGFRGNE